MIGCVDLMSINDDPTIDGSARLDLPTPGHVEPACLCFPVVCADCSQLAAKMEVQ
jgi:hypothetical protein